MRNSTRSKLTARTFLTALVVVVLPLSAFAQQAAPAGGAPAAAGEPACPKCPEPPPPPTTGTVKITATPADATVKLNGAPQKSGVEITAKPGTHNIEVTKAGYDAWKYSFQLKAGGSYEFAADLKKTPPPPKKPKLVFNFELGEDAATVTVDGKAITAKKGEAVEVEPGERQIKISQKGKKDWSEKLTLDHGATHTFGTFEAAAEDDALGPYVTIGLGVGLAALGLVFSSEDSDGDGEDGTSAGPANNTDEDRATAAIVLYTVGGALVATGITLIALNAADDGGDEGSAGDTAFVAPYASPDGAGLAGVLTF